MLSYRHHFHAGNFADVFKHFCLYEVLNYYNRKAKPYLYFDTHAGAGLYRLNDAQLGDNREISQGMHKLFTANDLPPALNAFTQELQQWLQTAQADIAGSPWIANQLLRPSDTLRACELHPNDFPKLQQNIHRKRHLRLEQTDGFKALIGALPPPQHRAVVLIDPPYEVKSDYQILIKTLNKALQRFASATILVWYPLLAREESQVLPAALLDIATHTQTDFLQSHLTIENPTEIGMYGTGMMIFNPPYLLPEALQISGKYLAEKFAQNTGATYQQHIKIS